MTDRLIIEPAVEVKQRSAHKLVLALAMDHGLAILSLFQSVVLTLPLLVMLGPSSWSLHILVVGVWLPLPSGGFFDLGNGARFNLADGASGDLD